MVWLNLFNGTEEKEKLTGKEKTILEYEDGYCRLDGTYLTIKNYYYPLGLSRKFPTSSIIGVHCATQELSYGNTWGYAWNCFESLTKCCSCNCDDDCGCTWWALSCGRECGYRPNQFNVIVDVGESSRKGFTVADFNSFEFTFRIILSYDVPIFVF